MVKKTVLEKIDKGYALLVTQTALGNTLFVGSEQENGKSCIIGINTGEVSPATDQVGGMMHIIPLPRIESSETSGKYLAAMGMYAPFLGSNAAVYMLEDIGLPGMPWSVTKQFEMPFVHRLGYIPSRDHQNLLVAVVSEDKKDPDDWSRPGRLYVCDLFSGIHGEGWNLQSIGGDLVRHHGMWTGKIDGADEILVSAAEGIFGVHEIRDGSFSLSRLIRNEVSEMVVADLDGDGQDELVTIEPFHGNLIRVYKRSEPAAGVFEPDNWNLIWERDDLHFAHGLNVIPFRDRQLIVVGNRRGGCELLCFIHDPGTGEFTRIVLDEGVGPTQIEPWFGPTFADKNSQAVSLFSCNQDSREVAMYSLTEMQLP
jgi:hypothetical protein